jgi:hypothetical protein
MRWLRRFALLFVALWLMWEIVDRASALMALPDGTGAWFVTFAENKTFGLGPGGNESGLNVVLLTTAGAARVAKGGAAWLDQRDDNQNFDAWRETPVPYDDTWLLREGHVAGRLATPSIMALYLRYGFTIDIPENHLMAIDKALNAPGSFYTFDRRGRLVLIVPNTQRAYVGYAG